MEIFCGNNQCVKLVGSFRTGAPSLMFDGILKVTEELCTTGVTKGNIELPLAPDSLDSYKKKSSKMKSRTDPTSSFPLRRTHPLGR